MAVIQFDPMGLFPEGVRRKIFDSAIEFLSSQVEKVANEKLGDVIRKLKSDATFQSSFDEGIKRAAARFIKEYETKDEDIAKALIDNPDFWESKSIRQALRSIIMHPADWLEQETEIIVKNFDDVLPVRKNREKIDQAITFFLRSLAEEIWHIPELQPIYELQLHKITAERATEMVLQLKGLRSDINEVWIAIVNGMAEQRKLMVGYASSLQLEAPQVKHNLPQPDYVSFVGRSNEFNRILDQLSSESRAWTIVIDGIGGIGKSALALEAAHYYLREYNNLPSKERFQAIIWTSAKSETLVATGIIPRRQVIRTLSDIYNSIALTLGREEITRSTFDKQDELILKALQEQRTLLIIDNLETIDDENVNAFLRELPSPTKCIVTTRHRIDVAYPIRLTGMPKDDAFQLISQECNKKGVNLTKADAEDLYERCGGVPLALVWSISQMGFGNDIPSVLHWLGQPNSDISRFCFEGTVAKIRDTHAFDLLLALSLFAKDADREVLGFVADLDDVSAYREKGLANLEMLSLVNKDGSRFSFLPLTKEYVLKEFQSKPEFYTAAWKRLNQYYINLVSRYQRSDFSGHLIFDIERDNIIHMLSICRATGEVETVAQIMMNFDIYLRARGFWNEALENLEIMFNYANEQHNIQMQAHANRAIGRIYAFRQDYDKAELHLKEAYKQSMSIKNIRDSLSAADYLSLVYCDRKDYTSAQRILSEGIVLAMSANENELIIRLQNRMAEIDLQQNRISEAKKRIEELLKLNKDETYVSTVALGLTNLIAGRISLDLQDFEGANKYFERSLNIARNRGIEQDIGNATLWMAKLLERTGRVDEAIIKAQEAFEILSRIGDNRGSLEAEALKDELSEGWRGVLFRSFTRVD